MSDDLVFMHSDKRETGNIVTIIPEGADEPGFAVLAECFEINIENCRDIFWNFRSDKKRIHPELLGGKLKEGDDRGLISHQTTAYGF